MNYMRNILAFVLLLLSWSACKKVDLPPTVSENPIFRVAFNSDTLNSQTVTAGENEIYLFTNFQSLGQQIVCSGSFSQTNCPGGDCPGSLTFEFMTVDSSGVFEPDAVFHLGAYQFFNLNSVAGDTTYRVDFYADTLGPYNTFSWQIDDQSAGSGSSITVDFPDDSPLSVELAAQKTTGLRSIVNRAVSLSNPGGNLYPSVGIDVIQDSLYYLTAEVSVPQYDTLVWSTGSSLETISEFFLDSLYSVLVVVNGIATSAELQGLSANDLPVQTANFTYTVEQIIAPPALQGNVAIQWVDNAGFVWRSDAGAQHTTAFFTVVESEPYEENERRQKTRKMRVEFSCRLFNDTGLSRPFFGSGVIAVAHP
jgi:hypothetical protein